MPNEHITLENFGTIILLIDNLSHKFDMFYSVVRICMYMSKHKPLHGNALAEPHSL